MKIRIIDIPPGEAPEEVRRAWVGLELPVEFVPSISHCVGILSQELKQDTSGYRVRIYKALPILAHKDPHAARWFLDHMENYRILLSYFVFIHSVCEVINDN